MNYKRSEILLKQGINILLKHIIIKTKNLHIKTKDSFTWRVTILAFQVPCHRPLNIRILHCYYNIIRCGYVLAFNGTESRAILSAPVSPFRQRQWN